MIDKCSPLDYLLSHPDIIPRLIYLLGSDPMAMIQFEAAWCITNISCGEMKHVQPLLDHHIVTTIFAILTTSRVPNNVKDQSLWALCNLSTLEAGTMLIAQQPAHVVFLLQLVGIQCNMSGSNGDAHNVASTKHLAMADNPALSTMRHVTFICSNILK